MEWTHGAIAVLALLGVMAPCSLLATENHVIKISGMRFDPPQMTIATGDQIEWKNEDIFSHTVTANDGSFDSGLIRPHSSWQTVIRRAGGVAYHCRPHPNMVAQIDVQSAGEQETARQTERHPHSDSSRALSWTFPTRPDELHPILVNFSAALLPLALLSDVLGRLLRRPALHVTGFWLVLYASAITPFTALAGWWWKTTAHSEVDHAALMTVHQWLGSVAAVLFVVLAVWRWRIYRSALPPTVRYLAAASVGVMAVVYQGSLGGQMAFGQ